MNTAVDQWPKRHIINVDEYYRMAEVGLLAPDARVELIEGEVIDMAPIGSTHAGIVNFLMRTLDRSVGERAVITVQQPVRLDLHSEPQPDVAVLKARSDLYRKSHPTASDVLLLIEVSDTTLRFDLGAKLALYARQAVPEVWVVDVAGKQVHRMREPTGDSYQSISILNISDSIEVAAFPDIKIALGELFD
jgi:Uma2 family endonuclease